MKVSSSAHQYLLLHSIHRSPTFPYTLTITSGSYCDSLRGWYPWPLRSDNLSKSWAWICHFSFKKHPMPPHHLKRKPSISACPAAGLLLTRPHPPPNGPYTLVIVNFLQPLHSPCCFTSQCFLHMLFALLKTPLVPKLINSYLFFSSQLKCHFIKENEMASPQTRSDPPVLCVHRTLYLFFSVLIVSHSLMQWFD